MKTFRDSPADARHYVEADLARADDYYLGEDTGIAQRFVASPEAGVTALASLTGDGYQAWVAGVDPNTGVPRGRLRSDGHAVRFVEVTVNGPKSWSLAAELHPDISAAYDAAQDAAAGQIIGWLAQHATVRVGPRGVQVQVAVGEIEAVTVRHRTSRAGDPHRHLHLQVNARVHAEGAWRGLHTIGVRDSLDAINGIGHAAVATDLGFRAALARHGFTLDQTGEIGQLAGFVGPFSTRAAQIGANIARYEKQWRATNPGREPDAVLWRTWDARAWADGRPDKIVPADGAELTRRWVTELHALGYRDPGRPVTLEAAPIGQLDRDDAVKLVLARVAARRSGWNAADVRGEVEHLITRAGIVTDASVRAELAEDLTARALAECVPLTDRPGLPEHIRALTSPHVVEVEADLVGRLAARADTPCSDLAPVAEEITVGLDPAQCGVVTALAGDGQLLVVEGAAGAGKTTTLAAARAVIEQSGGRLRVVTPTLKAARVAAEQVGGDTSSAAWLAYQYGFRWNDDGAWTRLVVGEIDPATGARYAGPTTGAVLRAGDLLLVDEAGMLDQDTARALFTIAEEHHARIALVGDRHQLPAVGRGGVLDLAARFADPEACLTLDTVHRFTRTITTEDGARQAVPDVEYADLSLAMRTGTDPETVFDALVERGQLHVHNSDDDRFAALAENVARALGDGVAVVVIADTNDQVAALNHAIRARLVAAGQVDDTRTATGSGAGAGVGCVVGVGDRVVTRRNNTDLGVANRDAWTVTSIEVDGSITVTGQPGSGGPRVLPPGYVAESVQLGYASTVYGVQGDTTTVAHLAVGQQTSAGSAYVGMTRGRTANVAHMVAEDVEAARQQWVAVFARDRADLGPGHAAQLAAREADLYAPHRPLDVALADLRRAWTAEQDGLDRLAPAHKRRDQLAGIIAATNERDAVMPRLDQHYDDACTAVLAAQAHAERLDAVVTGHAGQVAAGLQAEWDAQREDARQAARTVRAGSGRLGQRIMAVNRATEHLQAWSMRWQPYLPAMPTSSGQVAAFAARYDWAPSVTAALDQHAEQVAELACPERAAAHTALKIAGQRRGAAAAASADARAGFSQQLSRYGSLARTPDPAGVLAEVERTITTTQTAVTAAQHRIADLLAEPALRILSPQRIATERQRWHTDRDTETEQRRTASTQRAAQLAADRTTGPNRGLQPYGHDYDQPHRYAAPDHSPGIG